MAINIRDVRASDAPSLAHILVTANENAFRGLVPDKCLEFTEAESASNWQSFFERDFPENNVFLVAETRDNDVIGYAWGRPSQGKDFEGELFQISVLPAFQGKGIGRLLLCTIAKRLSQLEIQSLWLQVLKVNPNRAFYEHLGAQKISEHMYDWDGENLEACIYAWHNIQALISGTCD